MSTVETYTSKKLQCGTADLVMLDKVYSVLASSAFNFYNGSRDEVIEDSTTLADLLYVTYTTISRTIDKTLKEKIEPVKDQEGLGTYVGAKQENFNITPYVNYLNTSFNSDLDDVVDWNKDVEDNAQMLLNKWVEDYFNKED